MAKRTKEEKVTIKGKLVIHDEIVLSKLINLMRQFRDAVELAHYLLFKRKLKDSEVKRRLTRLLSNAWYGYSVIKKAKLYQKQPHIKLRKPLLFSVGCKGLEKGNRNIRLVDTDKVLIKVPHANGKHEWIECKVEFGRKYLELVKELVLGEYPYSATITVKLKNKEDWRKVFRKRLYLHLIIPLDLYLKYFSRKPKNNIVGHVAGFDFNVDRVNMVIIDQKGIIRDIKNEHFPEVTSHGFPRNKAKATRRESVAKLVKYAREHGVKYYVIEDLSKPKPKGTRTAKKKIYRMALREFIQQMEVLVPKVDGVLIKVNPAYSSVSARIIAEDLGLDVHTASAYIIAKRGLTNLQKP
ncbi:MAG: hypothetical protein B6U76_10295 [Desulfurococcales archaeon ex4484_217_2]|nr:MAG: hypothetical protein B6U76_10295 [Desulfurococcales archaeon ex4484_217_2]